MAGKPIVWVALAALVAVGAGAGAYLAVRDNRGPATVAAESRPLDGSGPTEAHLDTVNPVEATEEVIVGDTTELTSMSAGVEKAARQDDAALSARATPPADTGTTPAAETAARSPRSGRAGLTERPVADVGRPVELPPVTETLDLLALSTIDPAALGRTVSPEERPRIVRDLVIAEDSVVGLQVESPVSTEDAKVEDDVEARVTRDVVVDGEIAIPAGTRVLGSVVLVEESGQLRGAARLGVRFHTVILDDVFELPIVTETVYREGKGRGSESAAKIGGAAVGGAILGAIFGGRQGAAIGGAAGAAGGTAAAMAGDGQPATLPAGSTLTVRLSRPATVTIEYYCSDREIACAMER